MDIDANDWNKKILYHCLLPFAAMLFFVVLILSLAYREQTVKARQESKEKFEQAVQGNSIPTFIIDNKHIITHWNNACENLTGFPDAQMVGTKKHWLPFYPEERPVLAVFIVDGATEKEIKGYYGKKINKSILVKGAYEGEGFFPNLGEKGKWLFFSAAPLRDQDGTILGAIETIQDITERKQTEEALRESEEKYRYLVEKLDDIIWTVDLNFKTTYVSHSIIKNLGFTPKERMVQNPVDQMTQSSYKNIAELLIKELNREQEPGVNPDRRGRVEIEYYHKNGSTLWFENIISGLRDKNGILCGFHGVARDIAERKQTEEMLRESEEKYRSMIEHSNDMIWTLDQAGNFTFFNEQTEKVAGLKMKDWIGKSFVPLILDEDLPMITEVFQKSLNGGFLQYELRFKDQNKNILTIAVNTAPILKNGEINGIVSFGRDITEQKRLQEEVLKARKLESLGTLAGGIAHDLNNLLFAVMGNISLAEYDLKPEIGTSESLKAAEEACIKAKELSARLITFSKGGDPVKKMMSIDILLKDIVMSALSGSNIKPEMSISDDIRQVNIDEGQVKQVVRNIVANAKEAMNDNGQLTVSCENVDIAEEGYLTLSQGEYIKISFADQGSGISKENLGKIFDPYFSTKDMGADKGQGLGLTVSYSIIKKHGGLINVESKPGTGSIFSVYLPTASAKESDLQKPEEQPAAQKPVKKPATDTGKILLMDDEEAIRTFLGQALTRSGYDVETCIEGKEAVEIYKKAMESKDPFDVAILDLTSKVGMGGQETMRRLIEIDPDVKGIVITGYSNDPAVANFKAYGFSGSLTKPATSDELSKVINEVVSKDL